MRMVNLKTKSFEEVPDDQVQSAFQGGSHGFASPDDKIPIRAPDGTIGTVPASSAEQAFAQQATVVPQEEYHEADVEARRGGVGATLAAGAEGLLRGATVGISDPVQIKIAQMLGKGEQMRTALSEWREAHPYVSAGAEILGAAAPVLATGGAAGPEEASALAARGAAEAAPEAGRIASLLRVVGAPARAVAGAGEAAGSVAQRALELVTGSPAAESAIGRIARAAVKQGFTGAAEGALFGAGQQASEDALGDHELNAEKFVSAIGHGALYGAMLGTAAGAGLTAAKETIGSILTKAAPTIEREANRQAVRAIDPKLGVVRGVLKRGISAEEIGETAREFQITPSSPIEAAKMTPEGTLEKVRAAIAKVGSERVGPIVDGSGATVKASQIVGLLKGRMEKLGGTAAGKMTAERLQPIVDRLEESLGVSRETMPMAAAPSPVRVPRTGPEISEALNAERAAGREVKFKADGSPPDHILYKSSEAPAEKVAPQMQADPDVPIRKLIEERRALQHLVFEDQRAQNPKWPTQELREFTGQLNELEEKSINDAAHTLGPQQGTALREANKDLQKLYILQEAAERRVAAATALRRMSPTSYLSGMAIGAGSIAAGHPMGVLHGIAAAGAHQMVLEHGNAIASATLGKIAKLDLIARATQRVDEELDGAVKAFVSKTPTSTPKIRLRHFGSKPQEDLQERYDRATQGAAAHPQASFGQEHIERALPGMAAHAPKTAIATSVLVGKTAQYLAAQRPPDMGAPSLLQRDRKPSEQEQATYLRKAAAIEDPVGTLKRGLETGKVHVDEISAIAQNRPKMMQEFRLKLLDEIAKEPDSMTYSKIMTASKILGAPLDPSLTPQAVMRYQLSYTQPPAAAGPAPSTSAPKRQIKGISEASTLSTGQMPGG